MTKKERRKTTYGVAKCGCGHKSTLWNKRLTHKQCDNCRELNRLEVKK